MTEELNIELPQSWEELTEEQMRDLCTLVLSDTLDPLDVRLCLALRWGRLTVLSHGDDRHLLMCGSRVYEFTNDELLFMSEALHWIDNLPRRPSTPGRISGHEPCDPMLRGESFETFIALDNLFQGFLATLDRRVLRRMATLLYPLPSWSRPLARLRCMTRPLRPKDWQLTAVFLWFAAFKKECSRLYPNFLRPSGSAAPGSDTVRQSVNAMLRALTKGDVTKEEQVRAIEVHRALTELDALALEAEQLRQRMKRQAV